MQYILESIFSVLPFFEESISVAPVMMLNSDHSPLKYLNCLYSIWC